ncbi:MAG: ROK family protein [Chitinophagaceae bacterium]|nr:ROK family protein [Chitinophagaceae bacterium]
MSKALWGIDLGGTKIEGVILKSIDDPTPILRTRVDTEADNGYNHIVQQIKKLVSIMEKESGLKPERIGFGTPGVLDPILQTMKNCNSTNLNGMRLKKDVEAALGIPIEIANDANCFALAEAQWGVVKEKAPEARVVFGIIMGTGVGGGIVFNNTVWNGCHGIAGEWGHNFLDESGGPCYCGKSGCVEKVLSGPGLQNYYYSLTNEKATLKEIVARYEKGEDAAKKTIERLVHFFGKAVSVVTNLLDPDVIVIGGGVGNVDILYSEGPKALGKFIFNNRVDVKILKPSLGDSAGVFGAAALVSK